MHRRIIELISKISGQKLPTKNGGEIENLPRRIHVLTGYASDRTRQVSTGVDISEYGQMRYMLYVPYMIIRTLENFQLFCYFEGSIFLMYVFQCSISWCRVRTFYT